MPDIHINQFHAQYNIARLPDNPVTLQRQLDNIARHQLVNALEARLSQETQADDPICFIESIEVSLTIDLAKLDDRQLATLWADALQKGIRQTLGQRGKGVLIFRNRGDFLASFLEDLLKGKVWDCWYYQEFEKLRSLPLGAAIVTLLTTNNDAGRDALLELTRRGEIDRILAILTDEEVEAIAHSCLLPPSPNIILPNTVSVWIRAIRSLLSQRLILTGIPTRDFTRLYLELLHHRPELGPDVNLARFIYNLMQLQQMVMKQSEVAQLLQLLATEQWTGVLSQLERSPAKQLLTTLMREISGAEVVELLQELEINVPQTTSYFGVTAYGGIFLLISAIADLQIDRFLQNCPYPQPENISKIGLLLWLIALQCLGNQNAVQAKSDRGITLFAGLSKTPNLSELQNYAATFTPTMHTAFIEQFQTHLCEQLNRPEHFALARLSATSTLSFDWFSLCTESNSLLPDPEWDAALAMVSATILQAFSVKLGAFADSSPAYLCRNFWKSQSAIELSANQIIIQFLTCPLQMVLRMAGFDHKTWEVSWLENRQLSFQFD
ncbi:hypothetical protein [Floridanema aerugineum]|uniref:Uncharacterized protein n=1 Tax=Floridaenema aerugineum BLCC-F46 TaxID=3153654 RepID=A0ABV4XFK5_9CYAN